MQAWRFDLQLFGGRGGKLAPTREKPDKDTIFRVAMSNRTRAEKLMGTAISNYTPPKRNTSRRKASTQRKPVMESLF